MSLKDALLLIITNSVIVTALFAIIGFFGRSLIDHWLSKRLEKYKIELQALHAKELENLKTDLEKSRYEYETQFSRFNNKKFEVIENLYKLIARHSIGLNKFISRLEDTKARSECLENLTFEELCNSKHRESFDHENDFPQTWTDAWYYFCENRLYLSEDLAKKIQFPLAMGLFALMPVISVIDFDTVAKTIPSGYLKSFEILKDLDPIVVTEDAIKEFNGVLEELEKEFRSIPRVN